MNDEGRHYGFFFDLLVYTWQSLDEEYKEYLGSNFANFIKLYLNIESEKHFNENLLNSILNDKKESKRIVDKLYGGFEINQEIPIVKNVIKVLKQTKLLEDKYIKASFKEIGWVF